MPSSLVVIPDRRNVSPQRRPVRNVRLLVQAGLQHVLDDPALLVIQVSRRLPLGARQRIGKSIQAVGRLSPRRSALGAFGAFMAGDDVRAIQHLVAADGHGQRLASEVAVLLDRTDLVSQSSAPAVRARALWSQGNLTGAVNALGVAGKGNTVQARRLRNERDLLEKGYRLAPPQTLPTPPRHAEDSLRVLHLITNSLPHTQSGYAYRTHNILTELAAHGIESIALTRTGYPVMVGKALCGDEDVVDGIRYRRTLPSSLGETSEARLVQEVDEAMKIVEEFRPHVLHATSDYRNALVAQAVSVATGILWVFEVRGLMEQTWIASHRSEATRDYAASSEKVRRIIEAEASLALEADAVVTLSRTMADVLIDRGIPRERITLVPNGVDETLLSEHSSPAEARRALNTGFAEDALVVGAVSALVAYEGFDVLLRAVATMLDDGSVPDTLKDRLQILLVGDGVAAPALKELAASLGLKDRLHMPGRVPGAEARIWVQALDLVVVPRRDLAVARTVTPQKPAEAQALGRPTLVSDLPALRETISDETGNLVGYLAAPDDPRALGERIVEVLGSAADREQTADRGRELARQRTWPALMHRYDRMYRSFVEKADGE